MNISLVYYSISKVIPFYQLNYCLLVSSVFLRCVGDIKYCIKRHCIKASLENLTINSRLLFFLYSLKQWHQQSGAHGKTTGPKNGKKLKIRTNSIRNHLLWKKYNNLFWVAMTIFINKTQQNMALQQKPLKH